MSARDLQEWLHPTCIEVTPRPGAPREWLCGPECPPLSSRPRGPRTVAVDVLIHRAEHAGADGLGYGRCVVDDEMWPCETSRSTFPRTAVPIKPDAARDARVAARRAADARKAGAALDRLIASHGEQLQDGYYYEGWRDGYEASEAHHNGHYGVPDQDANDLAALNRGYAKEARRQRFAVGNDPLTGVPVCEHGDDVEACQLAHHKSDSGVCPAHGPHPHNGMTCLDCPVCRPQQARGDA
jgi:hypothetical protein